MNLQIVRLSAARWLELAARSFAIAGVLWLLAAALRPVIATRAVRAPVTSLPTAAVAWARDPAVARAHVVVDTAPTRAALDAAVAIRSAGVGVTWSGDVPAIALAASPAPDPAGSVRLTIAAPSGQVRVEDEAGTLDTVRVGNGGAVLVAPSVQGNVRARWSSSGIGAAGVLRDSLILRPLLVLGKAGWEGKFVVAALEESGWKVATRLTVAPGVVVRQGVADATIDTARYSAVVVLDSSVDARTAGSIARYVRGGGGLVLAGTAALSPALAAIAPARVGAHIAARPSLVADSVALRTLGRYALTVANARAVVLTRYPSEIALAARREGAGRVVQTGSDESWRWRMEGREGSDDAHRAWWSRLVSSVAYSPVVERPVVSGGLAAPLAQITDALGPAAPAANHTSPFNPLRHRSILITILALLLIEWTSRRIRGAR